MVSDADEVIEALKRAFRADTDAELGEVLGVARSSIASWRTRGHVPRRYMRKLAEVAGENVRTASIEEDIYAQRLGLLRWLRDHRHLLDDYSACLSGIGGADAAIGKYQFEALDDLRAEMAIRDGMTMGEVYSAVVFQEFFANADARKPAGG